MINMLFEQKSVIKEVKLFQILGNVTTEEFLIDQFTISNSTIGH